MKIWEIILLLIILPAGSALIAGLLRTIIQKVAFYEKSKSALKKEKKAHPRFWQKLFMGYTLHHNNRWLTLWNLICYYVFLICSVIIFFDFMCSALGAEWIPFLLRQVTGVLWLGAPLLSLFSVLLIPRRK